MPRPDLSQQYTRIRAESVALCQPLEMDDYIVQTAPEVSPIKWHLAHTSWFFETMLLRPLLPGYREFHPLFAHLFNSYYDTLGSYHPRLERGRLSRPTVTEIYRYRAHVDEAMARLFARNAILNEDDCRARILLGLHHEQQHQELMLMDIKHIFAYNPLRPIYGELATTTSSTAAELKWIDFQGGVRSIGHSGAGFAYDNEGPRHKTYLQDFHLASRPVTNGEFMAFMQAGAYSQPGLWLSEAWQILQTQGWQAPLYWERIGDVWWYMTLGGLRRVDVHAPVCHVSYYEAAAYAAWVGARLPTEAEWEVAAVDLPIEGNLRDAGFLQPQAASSEAGTLLQLYGDVWEWTLSAYAPYPGYRVQSGPLGEYNGKFMNGQMVLRGGSCVTPADHVRSTYRNFFHPGDRWQFSGFRLARDAQ